LHMIEQKSVILLILNFRREKPEIQIKFIWDIHIFIY